MRFLDVVRSGGPRTVLVVAFLAGCSGNPDETGALRVGSARQADTLGEFIAVNPSAGTQVNIVVPPGLTTENIQTLAGKTFYQVHNNDSGNEQLWRAIHYLQEGIFKMTGKQLNVVSQSDLSTGIVLSTLDASPDIKRDFGSFLPVPVGVEDTAFESFYIGTSAQRTVLVANTVDGLVHAAVELLAGDHAQDSAHTVGYELLGLGPDWTYVPDYHTTSLKFLESYTGAPGFMNRYLSENGQIQNHATVYTIGALATSAPGDAHPNDEPSQDSWNRWQVGTHQVGASSPRFPGAVMQQYHHAIASKLARDYQNAHLTGVQTGVHGFLTDIKVGTAALRASNPPTPGSGMWIDADNVVTPVAYKAINGAWVAQDILDTRQVVDTSVDWVRNIVFRGFSICSGGQSYVIRGLVDSVDDDCTNPGKKLSGNAKTVFKNAPNAYYIFPTEMEDSGPADDVFAAYTAVPNWWPAYRGADPTPYALYGTAYAPNPANANPPAQTWWTQNASPTPHVPPIAADYPDIANAGSDGIYAFNNWLLREYDKYIDGLPDVNDNTVVNGVVVEEGRRTSTGKSKKGQTYTSFQSYSSHDVPPNFNVDSRVRVSVTGSGPHRGKGKWLAIPDPQAMLRAVKTFLPGQKTSSVYAILGGPYDDDHWGTIAGGSHTAAYWKAWVKSMVDNGSNAFTGETNLNFGRQGLDYYMLTKMLWDPTLTADGLDALRTRWMQKAFGPAATIMKTYYDKMAFENFEFNGPSFWANLIAYINQAETAINNLSSPYQQRLDDVKQYWYFYYLKDTVAQNGGSAAAYDAFTQFVWKGQMSYMTNMYMVTGDYWANHNADTDGAQYVASNGSYLRAHYLHSETAAWWTQVLAHWPVTNPSRFAALKMANNQYGSTVDTHDLVPVVQFRNTTGTSLHSSPTYFSKVTRNPYARPDRVTVETTARLANQDIGFQTFWQASQGGPATVKYGVSYHTPGASETWTSQVPYAMGSEPFVPVTGSDGKGYYTAIVHYTAPQPGTYRFEIAAVDASTSIISRDYNIATGKSATKEALTFEIPTDYGAGGNLFYYIPKGSPSFDLELPASDVVHTFTLLLLSGLPGSGAAMTREITLSKVGLNSIPLTLNETGSYAAIICSSTNCGSYRFAPYVYSSPPGYALNLAELAVPRGLASADGLAELKDQHLFGDLTMANSKLGNSVDLLDATGIDQFQGGGAGSYGMFLSNPLPKMQTYDVVAKRAGDPIGFKMFWSAANGAPATGHYGLYRYDAGNKLSNGFVVPGWVPFGAPTDPNGYVFPNASEPSQVATELVNGTNRTDNVVSVSKQAPAAGLWRFVVQPTGYAPGITSSDFNLQTASYPSIVETFSRTEPIDMWYGGGFVAYIPKNVQFLDVELPDYAPMTYNFQFYTGLPKAGMTATRLVSLTPGTGGATAGFNSIPLNANEAGSFVWIYGSNSISRYQRMPYLDSIPMRFAFNWRELAVPRGVATADGLTALP